MYNVEGMQFLEQYIEPTVGGFKGKKICELGNQHIWVHAAEMFKTPEVARDYFVALGAEYVSLDLNKEDGAIPLDLSKPCDRREFFQHFDVVTNVGTAEHVEPLEGQYECFRTMHQFCKVGGIMVHALPPVGQWRDHCTIRYHVLFIQTLATLNNYGVVYNERVNQQTLGGHVDMFHAILRKHNDMPFSAERDKLLAQIELRQRW